MSDSLIQLQSLGGYRVPEWFTEQNRVYDDALEDFSHAALDWDQATGFALRLFNDDWTPDFTTPQLISAVPAGAWIAPGVALTGVTRENGNCKADGVVFPAVASAQPLAGACVYIVSSGRIVWAATDFFGNLPLLQQDVYVVFASGVVFKL